MDQISAIGDFTIFGFTPKPDYLLQHRILTCLGIDPYSYDIGSAGSIFFHTTYGDVAENDEAFCVKIGFLRSLEKSALTAENLLSLGIVRPGNMDFEKVRGNALTICLDKNRVSISAFKTLLSVPQLYYTEVDGGIICSDRLKCLVQVLEQVDLNEDIIPFHFLFRSTPGEYTYYRQIHRLLPGGFFQWTDGRLLHKVVQDFRFINHLVPPSQKKLLLEWLYQELKGVTNDYVSQIKTKGEILATLLSGGVDSTLLQYVINEINKIKSPRSYSYAVHAPSFTYEIEYAKKASFLLHTDHTFVDVRPQDYPELIIRAITALGQPPVLENEPSLLSIAQFAHARKVPGRYFVSGQGADALFGLPWSRKLKVLHLASLVPGSSTLL